jgi:hypothetical protein
VKITIDFSDDNLTQLLKATFFGAWMKNATKTEDERDPAMDGYVQFVLGTAYTAGETLRITVDPQGRYAYAPEFEAVLFEQVDEYDDDVFWDELVDHLAQRDYWAKNPGKIGKALEGKVLEEAQAGIEHEKGKYDKEFEDRGVERLRLVR